MRIFVYLYVCISVSVCFIDCATTRRKLTIDPIVFSVCASVCEYVGVCI